MAAEFWGDSEDIEHMDAVMNRVDNSLDLVALPEAVSSMYEQAKGFIYGE